MTIRHHKKYATWSAYIHSPDYKRKHPQHSHSRRRDFALRREQVVGRDRPHNVRRPTPAVVQADRRPDPVPTAGAPLSLHPDLPKPSWISKAVDFAKELMREFPEMTAAGVSGLIGGFVHESQGLVPNINQGGKIGAPTKYGGYAWAQWTADRKTDYKNYCSLKGLKVGSDEASRSFCKHELHGKYHGTVTALAQVKDPAHGAVVAEQSYEGAGVKAYDSRIAAAKLIYGHLTHDLGLNKGGHDKGHKKKHPQHGLA